LIFYNNSITLLLFNRNKSSTVSEVVGGKRSVKSPSVSSTEEEDIMEKEEESDDVSDGDGMEQGIIHTFSEPLHHSQDPHPHTEKKPNPTSAVHQASSFY
jgi:hypothetical protein